MKLIVTIIILFASTAAESQGLFRVYKLQGKAFQLKMGRKIPVKMGNLLNENDSVFLDAKASVKFICNNYSLVDLKSPNATALKKLATQCKAPSNSYDAAYFAYIWEQLSHAHEKPEENRKKYMSNLGGAVRGCPGIEFDNFLDSVKYVDGNFYLSWKLLQPVEAVSIAFYNEESSETPIVEFPVKTDRVKISSLNQKGLLPGNYYWTVNLNQKSDCPKKYIEIWKAEDFSRLIRGFHKSIENSLDRAERNYRIGFYLEKDHFYGSALKYYEAALKADPGNALYKSTVFFVRKMYKL